MAIKILGTTVIDDSRNLTNINGLSQATWEAGTSTTETVVSPAKVKAAIESQSPGAAWELLSDKTVELTSNQTTVDITGLGDYRDIMVVVSADTTINSIRYMKVGGDLAPYNAIYVPMAGDTSTYNGIRLHSDRGDDKRNAVCKIYNFNTTDPIKPVFASTNTNSSTPAYIENSNPFSRLQFFADDYPADFVSGGKFYVWGRK